MATPLVPSRWHATHPCRAAPGSHRVPSLSGQAAHSPADHRGASARGRGHTSLAAAVGGARRPLTRHRLPPTREPPQPIPRGRATARWWISVVMRPVLPAGSGGTPVSHASARRWAFSGLGCGVVPELCQMVSTPAAAPAALGLPEADPDRWSRLPCVWVRRQAAVEGSGWHRDGSVRCPQSGFGRRAAPGERCCWHESTGTGHPGARPGPRAEGQNGRAAGARMASMRWVMPGVWAASRRAVERVASWVGRARCSSAKPSEVTSL